MFERLDDPRFMMVDVVDGGDQAFLTWDFQFGFRRPLPQGPQRVHGGSHLRFDPKGRLCSHCDYWDVAGQIYGKLPVVGSVMRWLHQRGAARLEER